MSNYPAGVTDSHEHFNSDPDGEHTCIECGKEIDADGECACPPEPSGVPCSYPGCDKLTTFDSVYGDLCYRHIRADNE